MAVAWDDAAFAAWLRLVETPRVGRTSARRLLAAFGSPREVLAASTPALREVVGSAQAAALAQAPDGFAQLLGATRRWLAQTGGPPRALIALGDPLYPTALLETADPPLLLYTLGRAELLQAPSLAVVGSRHPTPAGQQNARDFARALSESGLTIVSGLAPGIDGAAHEGALLGSGSTIAVVASGLDQVDPRCPVELARRIANEGLLVSEYSLGTPPLVAHFPERNRIIAGLTRGTLVIEAALHSGSLITARLAVEAGREVFAIPDSIHAPQARGSHALIKLGARLVETAQDVLEGLQRPAHPPSPVRAESAQPAAQADPLLEALGADPMSLDELVARTGWSAAALHVLLNELELDGQVARLPGQCFQRIARA
jgi:DNA processing protein